MQRTIVFRNPETTRPVTKVFREFCKKVKVIDEEY